MTIAAIYARFSSDRQRDESIEIQVEHCEALIEREGWTLGEIYTDYAKTGTNDKRPSFKRCIEDGKAGAYDVLVIYKLDRFARNVEISRRYKRELRDAGVRIVSVREGEQRDTPDGLLQEGMGELFAEYYSRNLSVVVRDGIRKNAENCKASGRRIFGFAVDASDHFVEDEVQAPIVRRAFELYFSGRSSNQISEWMADLGFLTKRGNPWSPKAVLNMLTNEAYIGVYDYAGVRVEGGMPAIVDRGLFMAVQEQMRLRKESKRKNVVNDFLLTDRMFCLECGKPMCGTSGTSHTGKKYSYYGCVNKDGCKLRVNANNIEDAVLEELSKLLHDEQTIDDMVASVAEYAREQQSMTDMYREELSDCLSRKNNLIKSLEEGIPASAVRDALTALEDRIEELEGLVAFEDFKVEKLRDEDAIRSFVREIVDRAEKDPAKENLLISTFVKAVYANKETIIVVFKVSGDDGDRYDFGEIKAIENANPAELPSSDRVRKLNFWSGLLPSSRTPRLVRHDTTFFLIIHLK